MGSFCSSSGDDAAPMPRSQRLASHRIDPTADDGGASCADTAVPNPLLPVVPSSGEAANDASAGGGKNRRRTGVGASPPKGADQSKARATATDITTPTSHTTTESSTTTTAAAAATAATGAAVKRRPSDAKPEPPPPTMFRPVPQLASASSPTTEPLGRSGASATGAASSGRAVGSDLAASTSAVWSARNDRHSSHDSVKARPAETAPPTHKDACRPAPLLPPNASFSSAFAELGSATSAKKTRSRPSSGVAGAGAAGAAVVASPAAVASASPASTSVATAVSASPRGGGASATGGAPSGPAPLVASPSPSQRIASPPAAAPTLSSLSWVFPRKQDGQQQALERNASGGLLHPDLAGVWLPTRAERVAARVAEGADAAFRGDGFLWPNCDRGFEYLPWAAFGPNAFPEELTPAARSGMVEDWTAALQSAERSCDEGGWAALPRVARMLAVACRKSGLDRVASVLLQLEVCVRDVLVFLEYPREFMQSIATSSDVHGFRDDFFFETEERTAEDEELFMAYVEERLKDDSRYCVWVAQYLLSILDTD